MDRFLTMHEGHRELNLPTEVETAWLHHRFVRIHPLQDGNRAHGASSARLTPICGTRRSRRW